MNQEQLLQVIQNLSLRVSLLEDKLSSKTTNANPNPFSVTKDTSAGTKFTPISPLHLDNLKDWREKYSNILSEFDMNFLSTLISYKQLSDKQAEVLLGIKKKIQKTKQFSEK